MNKPEPPVDLWERLASLRPEPRPADAFTIADYMHRFNIDRNRAYRELTELKVKGLAKLVNIANNSYWVLTSPPVLDGGSSAPQSPERSQDPQPPQRCKAEERKGKRRSQPARQSRRRGGNREGI